MVGLMSCASMNDSRRGSLPEPLPCSESMLGETLGISAERVCLLGGRGMVVLLLLQFGTGLELSEIDWDPALFSGIRNRDPEFVVEMNLPKE